MFLKKKNTGITLIEIMLSVAIISVVLGLGVPVYQGFQAGVDLNVSTNVLVANLRRAEALATAMAGDTTWGVRVEPPTIVLFQGTSYLTRNMALDEVFTYSNTITTSGINEVVFSKMLALPNTTGSFVFTSSVGNIKNISINEKGMLTY